MVLLIHILLLLTMLILWPAAYRFHKNIDDGMLSRISWILWALVISYSILWAIVSIVTTETITDIFLMEIYEP